MSRKNLGSILLIVFVLWSAVIFYFSSQPASISNSQSGMTVKIIRKVNDIFDITDMKFYKSIESIVRDELLRGRYKTSNALVRKSAHFGIYFILGVICSSFGLTYSKKMLMGFLLGISLPVTIAVLDEFNQGFVGRGSSLNDVIIDGTGAFIGTMVVICMILLLKGAKKVWKVLR